MHYETPYVNYTIPGDFSQAVLDEGDVVFKDETFWMTQKAIADLFDAERSVITKHISNIYGEEELFRAATSA